MQLSQLTAISPIDGRYHSQTAPLSAYFSEFALIKYRVHVEVEYFIFLSEKKLFKMPKDIAKLLRGRVEAFSVEDAQKIKDIEKTTNHDVKAVEYFIKDILHAANASAVSEWIHFGLTSQDINNTAIPMSIMHFMEETYLPAVINLKQQLLLQARQYKGVSILARTHGQPASPTKLGKEWMVFVERLDNQITLLSNIPYSAKFGGATGNFNAHNVAFPEKKWITLANDFVENKLGLQRMQFTTQIEHYDNMAALFDAMKRINTILIDFSRDVWMYISMDYFKQKTKVGEVGSSAMPHKVNPIDFENAEGNLGIANAMFEHLSAKLPISRLQRDLTDSTVLRNIGVPAAHTMISLNSIIKGMSKLVLNESKMEADLQANWAVVAEAIQTILRRENYPNPYEALKELTRSKSTINQASIHEFIGTLKVSAALKKELKAITPENYTGIHPNY